MERYGIKSTLLVEQDSPGTGLNGLLDHFSACFLQRSKTGKRRGISGFRMLASFLWPHSRSVRNAVAFRQHRDQSNRDLCVIKMAGLCKLREITVVRHVMNFKIGHSDGIRGTILLCLDSLRKCHHSGAVFSQVRVMGDKRVGWIFIRSL